MLISSGLDLIFQYDMNFSYVLSAFYLKIWFDYNVEQQGNYIYQAKERKVINLLLFTLLRSISKLNSFLFVLSEMHNKVYGNMYQ